MMKLNVNEDEARGKVWEMNEHQRCYPTETLKPENTVGGSKIVIM
jgi:hypothetical protein